VLIITIVLHDSDALNSNTSYPFKMTLPHHMARDLLDEWRSPCARVSTASRQLRPGLPGWAWYSSAVVDILACPMSAAVVTISTPCFG
jgi:hypothetical protein